MRPPTRPQSFAVAAAAVLLGATAGCGGDDEDTGENTGESWESTLTVVSGWDEVHPDATGFAELTTGENTVVELEVRALEPDTEYTAHLHNAPCDYDPPGGGHWLADPDGEDVESNIVQLTVTTDADGDGTATTESDHAADERVQSIVVHAPADSEHLARLGSDRVLCGDFDVD